MPLPKRDLRGQRATITMMELRSKAGKEVAVLSQSDNSQDIIIHRDGSISGPIPLTFRTDMSSNIYGS